MFIFLTNKGEQSIVILQPALVTLQSLNEINKSQGVGYMLTKSVGLSTEIPFIKNDVIFTAWCVCMLYCYYRAS